MVGPMMEIWPINNLDGSADIYLSSADSSKLTTPCTQPTHLIWCHFSIGRASDGPSKMDIVTFGWTLGGGAFSLKYVDISCVPEAARNMPVADD